MPHANIGIIGGSGLYKMDALKDLEEVRVETPFGSPSDALILGTLDGTRVAFWRVMVAITRFYRLSYRFVLISMR